LSHTLLDGPQASESVGALSFRCVPMALPAASDVDRWWKASHGRLTGLLPHLFMPCLAWPFRPRVVCQLTLPAASDVDRWWKASHGRLTGLLPHLFMPCLAWPFRPRVVCQLTLPAVSDVDRWWKALDGRLAGPLLLKCSSRAWPGP
jgi:hypothetical protein